MQAFARAGESAPSPLAALFRIDHAVWSDRLMTDLVDLAADALRRMPPAERDSMAQAVLTLSHGGLSHGGSMAIEPEHLPFVLEGLAQAERGAFAVGEAGEIVARAFALARARA